MYGYCCNPYMGLVFSIMENTVKLYEVVMARFAEKSIPQRTIARESGVPFSTVCKIAQGSVKEPSVHTVQRLFDYFQSKQAA